MTKPGNQTVEESIQQMLEMGFALRPDGSYRRNMGDDHILTMYPLAEHELFQSVLEHPASCGSREEGYPLCTQGDLLAVFEEFDRRPRH